MYTNAACTPPPSPKAMDVNNFRRFFSAHSMPFYFFGVTPINRSTHADRRRILLGVLILLLVVFWAGIVLTVIVHKTDNDKISVIANWIQILGNSLTLTITFGTTALKDRQFTRLLDDFQEIDKKLLTIGHRIPYDKLLRRSKISLVAFIGSLSLMMGLDFYITVCHEKMFSVSYWLLVSSPLVVYSMGMLQVMFFIHWIKVRCSLVNLQLKKMRTDETPRRKSFCILPEIPKEKDTLLAITNGLGKLSRRINEYFGLFFLSSLSTLFVVTAIQLYYCYVTIFQLDSSGDKKMFESSAWTLLVAMNLVIVNLGLVIGLTTVCEKVANEGTRILQNSLSLQMDETNLSSWMPPIVSQMRFSAFGFFSIDHNMLCSFMAALITYLVIFIQFYTTFGDKTKPTVGKNQRFPTESPLMQDYDRL